MKQPKQNKALKYFISSLMLLLLLAYYNGEFDKGGIFDSEPVTSQERADIVISERAINHILYGDQSGGGHMFGTGKPCKSEFPEDWDQGEIIETVEKIAANDNLPWEQQDNGYYVTEYMQDGIRVRVVMGSKKQKVITAYPTNVPRNPCPPHAANDNYNR